MDNSEIVTERSMHAKAVINDLKADIQAGQGTPFDRVLIDYIDNHPDQTFRECWLEVETANAAYMMTTPRDYPFTFDD